MLAHVATQQTYVSVSMDAADAILHAARTVARSGGEDRAYLYVDVWKSHHALLGYREKEYLLELWCVPASHAGTPRVRVCIMRRTRWGDSITTNACIRCTTPCFWDVDERTWTRSREAFRQQLTRNHALPTAIFCTHAKVRLHPSLVVPREVVMPRGVAGQPTALVTTGRPVSGDEDTAVAFGVPVARVLG
jgi:hypothetical protein